MKDKRFKRYSLILALVIGLLLTGAVFGLLTSRTPADVAQPEPVAINRVPVVLKDINAYRASKNLTPLTLNAKLDTSAQAKAEHLTANHYWSHIAPDGTTPWYFIDKTGYSYSKAGENLARCFKSDSSIVKAWIKSPAHEAELSGDYQDIGIGVAKGSDGCTYIVAHFGAPLK